MNEKDNNNKQEKEQNTFLEGFVAGLEPGLTLDDLSKLIEKEDE